MISIDGLGVEFGGTTLVITSYSIHYTKLYESCNPSTKNIASIKNFDSEKFLGKWYEIARLDHSFERGLNYVTATYTMRDDGKIKVTNAGVKQDGTTSEAYGKAYVKKTDDNAGELRVSFFRITSYNVCYTKLLRCQLHLWVTWFGDTTCLLPE